MTTASTTPASMTLGPTGKQTSAWGLLWSQTHYQLISFTRSPLALFLTIVLPTMILVMLNSVLGNDTVETPAGNWSTSQFYTGSLAVYAAVSVSYGALVDILPARREEGVLKRWHANPLPDWIFISGWIVSTLILAAVGVVVQLIIGVAFYGLQLDPAKFPSMLAIFIIGVLAFSALGVGVAGLVPNAETAPAVANGTLVPLSFISDVFLPMEDAPRWLDVLGNVFPLKPFVQAFQDTIYPLVDPPAMAWSKMAVVVAWGIFGFVLARATFKWEPPAQKPRRRSRNRQSRNRQSRDRVG